MLDRELVEAVKLAREAGRILLDIYGTSYDVAMKGEADPVTDADRRVNAFLSARISEAFPTDVVVAEESAPHVPGAAIASRCWFIDPLDGTKEFIAKNGEFSVQIGLALDGEAALGVVYQPTEDRLWRGVVGDGAFLEHGDKTWVLKPSDVADPAKLRLVSSRSHQSPALETLAQRLGITQRAVSGSVGLKVGMVAERRADLYVHLSDRSKAWDVCAPDAILRAAGGVFTDLHGHGLSYAPGQPQNHKGILACNRRVFDKISAIVSEIGKDSGLA